MWTSIIGLYQGSSKARKLVLKDKLRDIKMSPSDSVVSYLKKFSKVNEELAGVGATIPDGDVVNFSLLDFTKSWRAFIDGICTREHFPYWERFSHNYV